MPAPSDRPPANAATPPHELPATPLELAGQALLRDTALGWRVELVRPGLIGARSSRGRAVLLALDGEHPLRLSFELESIRSGAYPARYVLVLGGDASVRARLIAAASDLAARGIWLLHRAGSAGAWQSREPSWRERRLTRALEASAEQAFEQTGWSRAEAQAHARRLELDRMLSRSEAQDFERFRSLLARSRPRATVALVAGILTVFGLEALWGGMDLPPLLARMGSLVPDRALHGEWWRFFSCTFLHGGAVHVGLNVLVLAMLGRSLERFIGSRRFLLIYCAAGLAGSAASVLFVSSQSVGASGAIWGLLGAEAALAFHPRPLLPPALIGMSRRAAAVTLALNLAISFLPHVDLAAHVGGGLMGVAVLVLLAASGRLSSHGHAAPPVGGWVTGLAASFSCIFALGLVVAIAQGQPWLLDAAPDLDRVTPAGSPWSVEVPRGRAASVDADGASINFGNLAYDPSVVDLSWVPLSSPRTAPDVLDQLALIEQQLSAAPDGLEQLIPPHRLDDAERPERSLVTVRYRYSSNPELITDRAVGIIDGCRVRVDVFAWAALPRTFDGLATRVLGSVERAQALSKQRQTGSVFHPGVPLRGRMGAERSPAGCQWLWNCPNLPFPQLVDDGHDMAMGMTSPMRPDAALAIALHLG